MRLLAGDRQRDAQHDVVACRRQSRTSCQSPVRFAGRSATAMSSISTPNSRLLSRCARLNSLRHQPEASQAARDQEQHRLAAVGRLVQRALPALAGRDAAVRIEVEEDVVPAFARSQSRSATASALLALEWLRKMRATIVSGGGYGVDASLEHFPIAVRVRHPARDTATHCLPGAAQHGSLCARRDALQYQGLPRTVMFAACERTTASNLSRFRSRYPTPLRLRGSWPGRGRRGGRRGRCRP